VCQGPVSGIGTVWWDKNVGVLSSLPAAVYLGSDGRQQIRIGKHAMRPRPSAIPEPQLS
jgi:hypothetical protein